METTVPISQIPLRHLKFDDFFFFVGGRITIGANSWWEVLLLIIN